MNVVDLHIHPFVKGIKQVFKAFCYVFENVEGIYKDDSSAELRGYSCKDDAELPMSAALISWASVQRKNKKSITQWLEPDAAGKYKSSNDLFGEKATVLIIYYNSHCEDGKNDLIILYAKLAENPLFTSPEKFSINNKKIVAHLMETAVKAMLSREYEIHRLMEAIDEHYQTIKDVSVYKDDELLQANKKQLDYAYYILKEINKEHAIQVTLSKKAEQMITEYKGELQHLDDELVKAVRIALNTHSCPTGSLELDEFSLIGLAKKSIENGKSASSGKSTSSSSSAKANQRGQYSRTEALLNRLESAVKATIENDEKVTGQNVALHIKPFEISAAAISDSISKHHERIITLMAREPSQWRLLRDHFRPIQNVLALDREAV